MKVTLPVAVRRRIHDARSAGLRKLRQQSSLLDRPSYWLRPRLFIHGNKWCALKGTTVQTGVAGFGDTPAEAFEDFDRRRLPRALRTEFRATRKVRLAMEEPDVASPAWFLAPDVYREGSCCWVLYGSNVADGIAAFGATLQRACQFFDRYWFTDTRALANLGWQTIELLDTEETETGSDEDEDSGLGQTGNR